MAISITTEFQFHKGAIKTLSDEEKIRCYHCFNSIKVRLRLVSGTILSSILWFQFHKGAIKTGWAVNRENAIVVSIP